jgi:xylulokinase
MLADVFGRPVATLASQEGSAYGASLLAMVGTGAYSSVPEACRATIRETESLAPRAAAAEVYAKGYEVFRSLYPALKPAFGAM